jgi:hypothetical protein
MSPCYVTLVFSDAPLLCFIDIHWCVFICFVGVCPCPLIALVCAPLLYSIGAFQRPLLVFYWCSLMPLCYVLLVIFTSLCSIDVYQHPFFVFCWLSVLFLVVLCCVGACIHLFIMFCWSFVPSYYALLVFINTPLLCFINCLCLIVMSC